MMDSNSGNLQYMAMSNQCDKLEDLNEEEIKFVFKTLTYLNKPESIAILIKKGYSMKHQGLYEKYLMLGFTENDIEHLDVEMIYSLIKEI